MISFVVVRPANTVKLFVIAEDLQKMFVRAIAEIYMYSEVFQPDICPKFFKTKISYCDPTLNIDSVNQSSH